MIQALIFDFDGLILDTEISAFQSWQELYQEYHCTLPLDKWLACIGGSAELFDPYDYLEQLLERPIAREEIRARRLQRHHELIAQQTVLPGVIDYIAAAKELGIKIGVASSSSSGWVRGHLDRLRLLRHFDCLCCGDEVTYKKPHPELYLAALAALGVDAEAAIALEDSANGTLAAQKAGIFCVAIPNPVTRHLDLSHADLLLSSLAEQSLQEVIAEVVWRRGGAVPAVKLS